MKNINIKCIRQKLNLLLIALVMAMTVMPSMSHAATETDEQAAPTQGEAQMINEETESADQQLADQSVSDQGETAGRIAFDSHLKLDESGCWTYIDNDGTIVTSDFRTIDLDSEQTGIAYFGDDGRMATDLNTVDDKIYYFEKTDITGNDDIYVSVRSALKTVNENIYYFDENGQAVTSEWMTLDDKKYYFDSEGHRASGMPTLNEVGLDINTNYICTYTIYPAYIFLGYYIYKQRIKNSIAAAGLILSSLIIIVLTVIAVGSLDPNNQLLYTISEYSSLLTIIQASSIFSLMLNIKAAPSALIKHMDECSFGIYLIHMILVKLIFKWFGVNPYDYTPTLMVTLVCSFFAISFVAVLIYKAVLKTIIKVIN